MARRTRRRGKTSFGLLLSAIALVALVVFRGGAVIGRSGVRTEVPGGSRNVAPPPRRTDPSARSADGAPDRVRGRATPFGSFAACEAYLKLHTRRPQAGPRIGSWNIRWFPNGTSHGHDPNKQTDIPWLACAIATLDVDVLAVEEITQGPEGRSALLDLLEALDGYTHGSWQGQFDECAGSGRQHVGFLFDSRRVAMTEMGDVAGLNPGSSACALNLRPGYGAHASFVGGPDLWLVAVHLDSGVMQRDFDHRRESVARLPEVAAQLAQRFADDDLIVLGDWNTMGCKGCEGGDVSAEDEIMRIDHALSEAAFTRVPMPPGTACSHYYHGHAGLLDHVAAHAGVRTLAAHATLEVHGLCAELQCKPLARAAPEAALAHLSDHCPLVLELGPGGGVRPPAARKPAPSTHR
jgi:endonuclease/exonuclease/phosphatase family metal-dependent hydrolase